MPQFFTDFQDGDEVHRDEEGSELPGFELARYEAIGMLPQIATAKLPDGEHRQFVATVRDNAGAELCRATLTFHGERLGMPVSP